MERQPTDRLTLGNLASATGLKDLVRRYALNCRCEGKSPQTLAIYQIVLKDFVWYCQENNFPDDARRLRPEHVRQFLWYLASEHNRVRRYSRHGIVHSLT
jgi:hypothetical protein